MKRSERPPRKLGDPYTAAAGGKIHPHLSGNTCYCFFKVAMRMRANLDQRLTPHKLVVPQFAILRLLNIEGRMTQVELGSFMAMDKATMVRMLDGLEQRSYLKRIQSETDRRAKWLELTPAGKKVVRELETVRNQAEAEFLGPLTGAEKKQLKHIVSKLLK